MKPANILNIDSLPASWRDKDLVMLHACFQLLVDCVEIERLFDVVVWDDPPDRIHAKTSLEKLYQWWLVRRDLDYDPTNADQTALDQVNLHKLIDLRQYLWV